jgi:DNA-binding NarL/FixJ family response regulator
MPESLQRGRVLIVDMPRMLHDLVRRVIEDAPDLDVVGEVPGTADVSDTAERTGAQLVVTGSDDALESGWRDVLERSPGLRIVSVVDDGRDAHLYEMRPHRVLLGAISPEALLEVLRGSAVA